LGRRVFFVLGLASGGQVDLSLAEPRKRLTISIFAAVFVLPSLCLADIHSSPADQWTRSRKLARGIANVVYGVAEIPAVWLRTDREDGSNAAFTMTLVDGTRRSAVRFGYGVYEIVTFPAPTYKDGYRPATPDKYLDYYHGYLEFPPELGESSATNGNVMNWP